MVRLGVCAWSILFVMNVFGAAIEPFPGSLLISSTKTDDVAIHRLITGGVERINGQETPESSDYVRGISSTTTYELLDSGRKGVAGQYFKDQLLSNGQILFECNGRDCGSSSYWAHSVFNQSLLYGPAEDQQYLLGRLSGDRGEYVIVYLAKRATGKRYTLIQLISDVAGEGLIDSRLITSALRLQHRFVIPDLDSKVLMAITDVLNEGSWKSLAVVAHDKLQPNETVAAARLRTQARAQAVKDRLQEMGADTRKLDAFGAGPISPIDRSNVKRLELVLLR